MGAKDTLLSHFYKESRFHLWVMPEGIPLFWGLKKTFFEGDFFYYLQT